jgi:hypothetical protein
MDRPRMMPIAPKCPQCGFFHPPIVEGELCPMAKEKTTSGEEIDFSEFLSNLKKFLAEHIKTKNIKDYKKLFSSLMVEIIKQAESFQE